MILPEGEESVEELLSRDSFITWIEGRASEENKEKWEKWIGNDSARKQLVREARSLHSTFGFRTSERTEKHKEWARLEKRLSGRNKSESSTKVYPLKRKTAYSSVAAVILLLIIALGLLDLVNPEFYQTKDKATQVFAKSTTQDGEKKVLTLSDGSKITLNSNSSLRYPAHYQGGDLKVWLQGEAYFNVTHKSGEEARTLSVMVPRGRIQVLGTTFNVNTFQEATEVVLVEGRVNIEMKNSIDEVTDSHILSPGELSELSLREGRINTYKVNPDIYTAWTKDKLVFKDTPLQTVTKRIEQLYGVDFQIDEEKLRGKPISGSLPNDNLGVFLKALENILDRPVINQNGTIVLGEPKSTKSGDS